LKLLRILLWSILVLVLVFGSLNWVLPVGMSLYFARTAPAITHIVPQPLKDTSVSTAPGTKLSYVGYEFEVPWTDLDSNSTQLFPRNSATQNRADLQFRSGLRLVLTALPPAEWVENLARETNSDPAKIEAMFGRDKGASDYRVLKTIYEFTPDKMDHWSATKRAVSRDELLLMLKSIVPFKVAQSGIFYLRNADLQGFQQGSASPRQDFIGLHMFADDGSVEMIVIQKDYKNSAGVSQLEINRIVQSLRKIPEDVGSGTHGTEQSRSGSRNQPLK